MSLWLPNTMNYPAYKVDYAVRQYDNRLMFARNATNGDWCVFVRMPGDAAPYPVLGFQDNIPEPHEAIDRLKAADTMRHGDRIYKEVVKSQKNYYAGLKYNADQAIADSAERTEHMMRQRGVSPVIKSLPKGVSNNDA
jgi:hypothetical protein